LSVLVDANVLLYAKFSDFPQHGEARRWLDAALNEPDPVGIPWVSLTAFVRIATNRRILGQPLTSSEAVAQVQQWIGRRNVWMPEPGTRFAELFTRLVLESQASGNLVSDAYVAALALEHGLAVISTDADFAHFAAVAWHNPLQG
jgi:uncharacterized protein